MGTAMNRTITSALLAITLTLGSGVVAVAQAPKPAQARAVDLLQAAAAAVRREDWATAINIWKPLAAQGNQYAQLDLAYAYRESHGVSQDYRESIRLARLSAAQGNAHALGVLGIAYEKGLGVSQDYVVAHMWFNLYAAALDEFAPDRKRIAAKMTPAQIAEAQAMARKCQATNFKKCD